MSNVVIILTRLWLESVKSALICSRICSQNHRWQAVHVTVKPNISITHSRVFIVLKVLCSPIHTVLSMSEVFIRDAKEQLVEQLMKWHRCLLHYGEVYYECQSYTPHCGQSLSL